MEGLEVSQQLESNRVDYSVSLVKSVLSIVPLGSAIAEFLQVIPNQRMDRLVGFTKIMAEKLEQSILEQKLHNEKFAALLEEAITKHVVSAVSDERKRYIAELIANSLSLDDVDLAGSKQMLKLLGEISDVEIIWLQFYAHEEFNQRSVFYSKHQNVLEDPWETLNELPKEAQDKAAIQNSYKEHLARLGLLSVRYETEVLFKGTTEMSPVVTPKVDPFTKGFKVDDYEITDLGHVFLQYILPRE